MRHQNSYLLTIKLLRDTRLLLRHLLPLQLLALIGHRRRLVVEAGQLEALKDSRPVSATTPDTVEAVLVQMQDIIFLKVRVCTLYLLIALSDPDQPNALLIGLGSFVFYHLHGNIIVD